MSVPTADQIRLSRLLSDDLQLRINWAYNLEQEIAVLSGGGLTAWGLASQATYVHNGDPNGLVTAVSIGDFLIDVGTPALWIAAGAGTVWTQATGGGGGGAPTGAAGGDLGGTYPNPTVPALTEIETDITALESTVAGPATIPESAITNLTSDLAAKASATLAVGGDLTGNLPNPTLATAGPGATGPLGTASRIPVITIDAKGRVTGLSDIAALLAATGDATGNLPGALTLKNTGPGATGPLGTAVRVPVVTIDAQGRTTALTDIAIALAATGDATGTLPGALTLKNTGPGATGPLGTAARTPTVTIDAQGRVTALSDQLIALAGSQITSGTVPIGQIPTGTDGTHVPLGGVITGAGPTGDASHTLALTYNAAGQLTAVTNNAIAIAASQVTSGQLAIAQGGTNAATAATALANLGGQNRLSRTAVKTAATYTAAANEMVPVDTTSNSVTVTLPTAPVNGTLVGIRQIIRGGTNTVSIVCAGSDVFSRAAGPTTATLTLPGQEQIYQYDSGTAIWTPISDGYPLAQIDLRYAPITGIAESAVTNLVTDLGALQTQATFQAAQIVAHQSANAGYFVNSGGAYSPNASALTSVSTTVSTSLLNKTTHGLVANDTITLAGLTGATTGISNGVVYFVSATGLVANSFRVAATAGGTAITFGGSNESTVITVTQVGKLDQAAAVLFVPTTELNISAQTAIATTVASMADATNPKWVWVEQTAAGATAFNQGSAAASPAIPALTAARIPMALAYIPANATQIDTLTGTANGLAKLIDMRELVLVHPARLIAYNNNITNITNPTTLTTLLASAPSIPANSLNLGDTFEITASGLYKNTQNNSTLEFSVLLGVGNIFDYTTPTINLDGTNSRRWGIRITCTVISNGAAAGVYSEGSFWITAPSALTNAIQLTSGGGAAGDEAKLGAGISATVDNTAALVLDVKGKITTSSTTAFFSTRNFAVTKTPI